jgi:two-component system sensor histidine kinase/response regulator
MKKILVIDDEEWLREMVRMALQQRGFEVVEAENGALGLEVVRRELPDLVLCDVNMAEVDGYLTLSAIRGDPATASIPFILMTGLADQAGMRHGMELGADDYLPKPFRLEQLYAAVDARLKKAQAVRDEAERKLADLRTNISMMLPHELRTPLNGILAFGELLATSAETLPPEEVADMGRTIHDSAQHLQRLIENFLIYAQLELLAVDPQLARSLQSRTIQNVGEIVTRRASAEAEAAQRTEDLRLEVQPARLNISEEYLGKIVSELTSNAFKFSSSGRPVEVGLALDGAHAILTISDAGRGFSTEQIRRVGAYMQFDRKIQEQQGLGLGLTIARRLVELHGGSLAIQSRKTEGTTVTARFPTGA